MTLFEIFGLGAEFLFDAKGTENIVNVVHRLQTLDQQIKTTGTGIREFNSTLLEFSGTMVNTGATMIAKGAAQMYAVMSGVKEAADWQSEMVNAVRYMDDDSTEAQVRYNRELSETAKLLGKTKTEINESAVAYMMMGKSSDEALRLSKNAGYAAVAWDMTAGEVADSFRTIKAAFDIDLEDQETYQKYLDTINQVGNSTAATAADVVSFLSDGASALHNVANGTIEEAMGMASAARFANMSIAEFSTMVTRLSNQYSKGKLDGYFADLGVKIKTDTGEMRSFAEALYEVQQKWSTMSNDAKSTFASGVGGAFADRLSLYMGSYEEYKKGLEIAKSDNTGSAATEFNRVTDTYNMAIARLQVTLQDFGTAFWGTLLPPLTKFINIVTLIIDKVSGFMQAHPAIMKTVAGFLLLSGTAIVLGGSMLVVSGIITKFVATVGTGYGPIQLFIAGIRGMNLAFSRLGLPIRETIFRFGSLALMFGSLYLAWKYDLFNIRSGLENFLSNIRTSLSTARDLISDSTSVDSFVAQIGRLEASESVWDKLTLILTKFGLVWMAVATAWNTYELSDTMYQKLQAAGLLETVTWILLTKMKLTEFFKGVKEGFVSMIQTINDFWNRFIKPVVDFVVDNIILPLSEAFLGAGNVVEQFFAKQNAMFGPDVLEKWKSWGEIVGGILALLISFKAVTSVGKIFSFLGNIKSIIPILGGGPIPPVPGPNPPNPLPPGPNPPGGGPNPPKGGLPNPKTILVGLADLALIVGGFTLLVAAYGALSKIPGFNEFMESGLNTLKILFVGALDLIIPIGAIALLTGVMSKVSPTSFVRGLTDIAIILGGFTVIFAAYGALSKIPGFNEFIMSGGATLKTLFTAMNAFGSPSFIAMSVAMGIAGLISPAVFATGLANIAIILGGVTAIISAFSALSLIPGFDSFLASGGDILVLLFSIIGRVVGAVIGGAVGGIVEGATSALPAIGRDIALFAENVKPFFYIASYAPIGDISGFISAISSFVLAMSGEKLMSLFTGKVDYGRLGTELTKFAENAKGFFETVNTFPNAGITKSKRVFEAMGNITEFAPRTGGLAQMFTGRAKLDTLGRELSSFALGSRAFFVAVAEFPEEGFDKGKKVFETLSEIGDYSFRSGGLSQLLGGYVNLDGVTRQLLDFALPGKAFFVAMAGIPDEGITNTTKVFEALNGITGFVTLSNSLNNFGDVGNQLSEFITNAELFFVKTAEIDTTGASETANTLSGILKKFQELDFSGLSVSAEGIDSLGTAVGSLCEKLGSVSVEMVGTFEAAIVRIQQLVIDESIVKAGIQTLDTLVGGIKENQEVVKETLTAVFQNCEPILPSHSEGPLSLTVLTESGKDSMSSISSGINSNKDAVRYAMISAFQDASAYLPGSGAGPLSYSSLYNSGASVMRTVASGINSNSSIIKNAVSTAFDQASAVLPHSDAPEGPFSSLTASGRSIPITIAKGIEQSGESIYSSLYRASDSAMNALTKRELGLRFPSVEHDFNQAIEMSETMRIVDSRKADFYEIVIVRLDMILNTLSRGIVEVMPSGEYVQKNVERVDRIQERIAENNVHVEYTLKIEEGAIVIAPRIEGGNKNEADIAEIIRQMVVTDIFPEIKREFERLQELRNR